MKWGSTPDKSFPGCYTCRRRRMGGFPARMAYHQSEVVSYYTGKRVIARRGQRSSRYGSTFDGIGSPAEGRPNVDQ